MGVCDLRARSGCINDRCAHYTGGAMEVRMRVIVAALTGLVAPRWSLGAGHAFPPPKLVVPGQSASRAAARSGWRVVACRRVPDR